MPNPANQFAVICFIRCSIPRSRALARNDESDDAAERMKKNVRRPGIHPCQILLRKCDLFTHMFFVCVYVCFVNLCLCVIETLARHVF